MPLQIGPQRSDIVIDIQNVLARNRSGSNLRYTTADQRGSDPEDTLFDFLPGLNASDVKWGA